MLVSNTRRIHITLVLTASYSRPNDVQNSTFDTVFVTQSPYYKFMKHVSLILLIRFIRSSDWLRTYVFRVLRGKLFWYMLHYYNIQGTIHSFLVRATIMCSVTSPNVCDTWTQFEHLELFGAGNRNLHELLHLPSVSWRYSNKFLRTKGSAITVQRDPPPPLSRPYATGYE